MLSRESKKSQQKRKQTAARWFENNPPDEDGYWDCYLQISDYCHKRVNRPMITLEHCYPKFKYPELKHVQENIKPSCAFCNKLKGSKTLQQLARIFPKIDAMLKTPYWIELCAILEARSQRHLAFPNEPRP